MRRLAVAASNWPVNKELPMLRSPGFRGCVIFSAFLAALLALAAGGGRAARAAEGDGEGDYRFDFVATANSYMAAKVHKSTGQAWVVLGGVFNKTTDAAALPAGDYRLKYVLAGDGSYSLFRYDAKSGRMWYFTAAERKWTEYEEK
jgi:hypothetical protein